jgi:transglutaminase-like putative cysteine protease
MSNATATRRVGCELLFDVLVESRLALHVAVAETGSVFEERLRLTGDSHVSDPIELSAEHGGRIHVADAAPGLVRVSYSASIGRDAGGGPPVRESFDLEQLVALRQSRYCPSDLLTAFALATFGEEPDPIGQARRIASWVFERLNYEPGISRSTDTAIDTLLGGQGVCRDFAHLTITLCRALGIPARLVSAYAPGLTPMDFHAVTEVWSGTAWEILDATRLAPRSSMVRIATGRDAADTAFATTIRGDVRLVSYEVIAIVDGDLPADDHVSPSTLS